MKTDKLKKKPNLEQSEFENRLPKRKLEPVKKSKLNVKSHKFWEEVYDDDEDLKNFSYKEEE